MAESTLARLIHPLSTGEFLAEVFGGGHHHIVRDAADYFGDLVPGAAPVDALLAYVQPDASAVRTVRTDEHKDSDAYRLADGSLDLAGVHADFADGYTVVLDRLERYARPITTLSHSLEVELNFPVQVNAYLTPAGAVGFLPHYDHHDVLVLQVHGSKLWHLHGDTAVPAHEMQRRQEFDPDALPPPSDSPTDVRLSAGDTFYLPRGRVHSAETAGDPSVHLTVGLHVPTALTLLTHTLHLLSLNDDRIHARLPPRHLDDPDIRAGLADLLGDALRIVASPAAVDDGLDAMRELLVRRGRCPPVGQGADVVGIDPETRVARHRPLYSRVSSVPTGGVALHFGQLSVNAADDHEAALRFLCASADPFRIGDLPGLTAAQQTELARTLLIGGFLVRL